MNHDVAGYLCATCVNPFVLANGVHQADGSVRERDIVCRAKL